MDRTTEKPVVFAKFAERDVLGEQGRLLFFLLNAFATSGHRILLFDNMPAEQLGKYGLKATHVDGLTLTTTIPDCTDDKLYLFDREDKAAGRRRWLKRIQVRFDVFSPYWLGRPVLMPYPIHPVHTEPGLNERLAGLRSSNRSMRVFFSGETKGYTRNRINYPRAKLPRLEVINALLERMGDRVLFVQDQATLDRALSDGYAKKCVILDTNKLRIPDREWLGVLSKADFFLAPPGIVMPMCHNAVEALAVGTIPVINYAEWFDPDLEHLRNCVAFDDKDDLIGKLDSVLAMDEVRILEMRKCAAAYYDAHLSSRSFMAKIEARREPKIDVLMVTEAYVGKNAHRLNGRSVLMRGNYNPGVLGLLKAFIRP